MRVRKTEMLKLSLALLILLFLAACGGGGTNVAGGGGGISGTGKQVVGEVTGFGSIIVNGVKFSTVGATITVDDLPASESDLKAGMIVKVNGTVDDLTRTGTAVTVMARDALEGRVDAVGTNNTITVMGQLVRLEDNVTRFNDNDATKTFASSDIVAGDVVEIHGYPDEVGGLRATRVVKIQSGELEAKGFVAPTGPANSFGLSLVPGGAPFLTVRYSNGQLPAGFASGSRVQVKAAAAPVAGEITASQIRLEDKLGTSGDRVAVEGFVTGGLDADFEINGQRVITDSSTLFEGGLKSDFAVGDKLEAEGTLNSSGVIVASRIAFRSTIKLEGDASNLPPSGQPIMGLTVLGKQVVINSFSRVDTGLVNGSHVEVRASLDRNGNLLASRVVVLGISNKAILQGGVSASNAAAGTLTILEIPLISDGNTQWRVSSTVSETAVTKDVFYSSLKPYSIVKVRWDAFSATTDAIKEAEIEVGK